MVIALLASACLAEATPQFRLELAPELASASDAAEAATIGSLYDRRSSGKALTANWLLHPVTGLLVATAIGLFILSASRARVVWMQQAGDLEGSGDMFQVYLPVILYGAEIALGIPALFMVVVGYSLLRVRRARSLISRERDKYLQLRHGAVRTYTTYIARFDEYNVWARQQGRPERRVIPPNRELQQLLVSQFDGAASGEEDRRRRIPRLRQLTRNPSDWAGPPREAMLAATPRVRRTGA